MSIQLLLHGEESRSGATAHVSETISSNTDDFSTTSMLLPHNLNIPDLSLQHSGLDLHVTQLKLHAAGTEALL